MFHRWFRLAEHQTTVGRELQAGLTTFAAMAYILVVNPSILAETGMDRAALVTATALSAALSTLLMAVLTNFPLALAPGMGINAYFTYTLCLGQGIPWQDALGMVCINGVIFLALSVTGLREKIVHAIPHPLKVAITCGIGLFIAFLGLKNGGLVVGHPVTLVTAGDLGNPGPALCFAGILLMLVLVHRRVPGGIILTVLAIALVGVITPDGAGGKITTLPSAVISSPASPSPVALELRFDFVRAHFWAAVPIILTLLFVDMFDNIGTLIGVTRRARLLRPDGTLPRIGRALVADSTAAILSSLFGTSTVVSYVESAAGVEAGGRTGLTAVTTAALFVVALVFSPLILAIPAVATAPALVVVGIIMMQSALELDWQDFPWIAPAVVTMLVMPVTLSISEGIGFGMIVASILLVAARRAREMPVLGYVIAALFLAQFFRAPLGRWLQGLF